MSATLSRRGVAAVLLAAAIANVACERDHRFETVARYRALASGYELSVHATGIVRAGDDLSDESSVDVRIVPTGAAGTRVELSLAFPDRRPERDALAARLTAAGYTVSADELAETVRAIGGALAGPKATLMDGQTKVLRVVDVDFPGR